MWLGRNTLHPVARFTYGLCQLCAVPPIVSGLILVSDDELTYSFNHEFFCEFMTRRISMNECLLPPDSFPFMFHRSNHPGVDSISYPLSHMFVTPNDVWSADWLGFCTSYQIESGNWEKQKIVHIKPLDEDKSWNIVILFSLSQCLVGKTKPQTFSIALWPSKCILSIYSGH